MSEQYQQYGDYEDAEGGYQDYGDIQVQAQQQDYQTKVELDYFQAEELIRKNQIEQCITSLEQLYKISTERQLKNWKVKILNFLLQIYCRADNSHMIQKTLERISELNKHQKYTENAIKSIIMTIKSLPQETFNFNKNCVYGFIAQLDNLGKIRSYLLFLEKSVEQDNTQQAENLFKQIKKILNQTNDVPASNLIQLFSFQIRHSRKTNTDISKQIVKMRLKISTLQAQSYMSEGHISIIKEAIAETLYTEDNFHDCATYLCQAFQDNMKYSKNAILKKSLLKTNVLVALLTNDQQFFMSDKSNALYHECALSFKTQNDIQALYGIVQAFTQCDLNSFIQQTQIAQLNFSYPYENLLQKVLTRLKMSKLFQIIKPYSTIKLQYLQRRLNSSEAQVQKMLFELITDNKIKGRIRKGQNNQVHLDIATTSDEFLEIQLENIREISRRYL